MIRSYAGDGGLSYAHTGLSYRNRNWSIGINFGYLFGNYRNFTSVLPIDTAATNKAYQAQFARYTRIGGLYWKAGMQYHIPLKDSVSFITLGATFALGQNLKQTLNYYEVSIYNFGDTIANDTTYRADERLGKLKMPMTMSIGAVLTKGEKYVVGLDYSYGNWSGFSSQPDSNFTQNIANNAYRFSVGAAYTPNIADLKGYFSRVTYRIGAYYGKDYIQIGSTSLPYYGVTVGGSFPYKRSTRSHSRIHASLDFGSLGVKTNGLAQHSYFRLGLGFSFNERWFVAQKYE
ncbi:MAG: hypothetical protein EBX41_02980 [Chitinophagia bacterium]|nr:hypothetical protein [Chitinophagia bacterium]